MLVIVGRQWLRINDEAGRRRLDLRTDWVRREIETAIKRGITVVPVLVQNASMPSKSHLPPCLRDLTDCNAVRVNSDAAFADDMNRLIAALPASLVPASADLLDALEFSEDEEAELQGLFTAVVALIDDHQYTAAIRIFERAVQLDPYDGEFWLRLGEAHWGAKRLDKAVAAFARCTTLESDNSLAWSFSAYVYGEQSRFEEELAAWR